jgi:cytochrome c-type biogenesis protein CcmH
MMKTTALWIVFLSFSALIGCDQHVKPLPRLGESPPVEMPAQTMPPDQTMLQRQNMPSSSTMSPASGGSGVIAGTITIAPELASRLTGTEVLFIMARRASGGAPLAVKRVSPLQFPMTYRLTSADQMVQGPPFSGEVSLSARIDRDGNAGPPQPGDMEGNVPRVIIGTAEVDILIDRVY